MNIFKNMKKFRSARTKCFKHRAYRKVITNMQCLCSETRARLYMDLDLLQGECIYSFHCDDIEKYEHLSDRMYQHLEIMTTVDNAGVNFSNRCSTIHGFSSIYIPNSNKTLKNYNVRRLRSRFQKYN